MLNQELKQNQQLNMNINLRTAIDLLSKSVDDLIDFINREAEENVFVEFVSRDKIKPIRNTNLYEDNDIEDTIKDQMSLEQKLMIQLREQYLDDRDYMIASYIINSLNDKGFFIENLDYSCHQLQVSEEEFNRIWDRVKSFEPTGIASRDYKECLYNQARDPKLRELIENYLEKLATKDYEYICKNMNIERDGLNYLVDKLKSLNPYPRIDLDEFVPQYVDPDVSVEIIDGKLLVNIEYDVELKLNNNYIKLKDQLSSSDNSYINRMYYRANYLKKAIETRARNLRNVTRAIVEYQKDFFFERGNLKPLTMTQIAEICQISQSSVSRITSNKYLQFKNTLYTLKSFFPHAISNKKGDVTAIQLKKLLKNIIDIEDKMNPYSDAKIEEILRSRGYEVKRRTVTKYREELGIESKYRRKIIVK